MPAEDDVVFSGDFVPQSLCFSAETFDKCWLCMTFKQNTTRRIDQMSVAS
jgi:hypothetical protein